MLPSAGYVRSPAEQRERFREAFGPFPIFGMIHLAGEKPVEQALEELRIYAGEGLTGAIIENYHSDTYMVRRTLDRITPQHTFHIGVNILANEFAEAFRMAGSSGAAFIQLDYVAGKYRRYASEPQEFNHRAYQYWQNRFPEVKVFGGVWPKYYEPVPGSDLAADLRDAMGRADAVVVTGSGTGAETPLEKIAEFRKHLGPYPLIVGAGMTPENAAAQLAIADGAIVGTAFKEAGNTKLPVELARVKMFMDVVRALSS